MDDRNNPPFLAQDAQEIGQVLSAMNLNTKGKGGGFKCRKKTFAVGDRSGRTVVSWSVFETEYKKDNLPTYARGLFTHSNNGKPEIVCRGYDKFFNVGEVRKTEWGNIEKNTRGPYELSVKENGCIIFIGGLDDKTLLITSKHSTGPRQDGNANHAEAGEKWLDSQLSNLGKSREEFAKVLRTMNATAVAELCDDEFEEHVLEYPSELAGLYLHGINLNLPDFATYPGNLVAKFAEEWGFRKVTYVMKDTIGDVKPFLEAVSETGNYNGRDTEGFVIRCQARESSGAPWHDWFFKYKFEEPYLMYRQWREATKAVIAGKTPRYRKHVGITDEYLAYARRQLAANPRIARQYNQNHGIIAMRDGFLKEKGLRGSDIIKSEEVSEGSITKDVILVPVATLGCGKTTIALALVKLFGWGHEQNDNIQGKDRPRRFASAVSQAAIHHPVVIADRNNHQRRERDQIIGDLQSLIPKAKFVALHWVHDRDNYSEIRRVTQDRVLQRGDNHQTIQAASKASREIIGIMEGFLHRFEPVNTEVPPDDDFDLVIDLDVAASSRENLETVVRSLHHKFPKLFEMPLLAAMDAAIEEALSEYRPDIKHDLSKSGYKANKREAVVKTAPRIEYFCISLPSQRIRSILDATFNTETSDTARFYNQMKATRRIQQSFHVTLIHRASSMQHEKYWNRLENIWYGKSDHTFAQNGTDGRVEMGKAHVQVECVVWDERVMAILVRLLDAEDEQAGAFKTVNEFAHITVGTAGDSIKPKESNDLLKAWSKNDSTNIRSAKIGGHIVLEGIVQGILSR